MRTLKEVNLILYEVFQFSFRSWERKAHYNRFEFLIL